MSCNHNCNQGRTCDCGRYHYSKLDAAILAVAIVFAASCIGYLIGGIR